MRGVLRILAPAAKRRHPTGKNLALEARRMRNAGAGADQGPKRLRSRDGCAGASFRLWRRQGRAGLRLLALLDLLGEVAGDADLVEEGELRLQPVRVLLLFD